MPVPHSLQKVSYRSSETVQKSGYFYSSVSYIKVQIMTSRQNVCKDKVLKQDYSTERWQHEAELHWICGNGNSTIMETSHQDKRLYTLHFTESKSLYKILKLMFTTEPQRFYTYCPYKILNVKDTTATSKVNSLSHHDVSHLQPPNQCP